MSEKKVLLSFVGNHDPFSDEDGHPGPVLSLLEVREFDEVFLIWTGDRYLETAKAVAEECGNRCPGPVFRFMSMELRHVIDYEEIYASMLNIIELVKEQNRGRNTTYSILLDPGTPQMQTCWFLLVRSGTFPAALLQGVPPRFTGGVYRVREVSLESDVLPVISRPDALSPRTVTDTGLSVSQRSRETEQVYTLAEQYAPYDLCVLIQGETGTGKEVLAKFIHENSPRASEHFLTVNCAGLNPELAESTLFGHKKGAFTGAVADRIGCFKAAAGGTLFLDEVGDLPLAVQPKLLRALEYKAFLPVGASKEESADLRFLCATNRNLKAMIKEGTFREDLYQRLNQAPITLPPLRDRQDDIPLLIHAFLKEWNSQYGEEKTLHPDTLRLLLEYAWPGNIRELKNLVFRLCAISLAGAILPEHVPADVTNNSGTPRAGELFDLPDEGLDLKALLFNVEETYYRKALKNAGGNREKAASLLGLKPHTYRKALKERFGVE